MTSITMQDFNLLRNESDLDILDIRDTNAFDETHLEGALSIPATSLPNELAKLDKNKIYFVISYSGRRSEVIARFLETQGYKAVHVIGGMKALRSQAA